MTNKSNHQLYGEDLSNIHIIGYGFHWSGAAEIVLQWLKDRGIDQGTVIDLGCGGGQWLERLIDAGYQAYGVDVSPNMLKVAKQIAPKAKLILGSFADISLPNCDAVTAMGEPLNYLNSGPAIRRTLRNVYKALRPGGVFVFDARHPATGPIAPVHSARSDRDWFCHCRTEENYRTNSMIRYITTFKRVGKINFRKNDEIHRLKVYSRAVVSTWLREIGFRVRTRRAYGDYELSKNQSVFICRKPG